MSRLKKIKEGNPLAREIPLGDLEFVIEMLMYQGVLHYALYFQKPQSYEPIKILHTI